MFLTFSSAAFLSVTSVVTRWPNFFLLLTWQIKVDWPLIFCTVLTYHKKQSYPSQECTGFHLSHHEQRWFGSCRCRQLIMTKTIEEERDFVYTIPWILVKLLSPFSFPPELHHIFRKKTVLLRTCYSSGDLFRKTLFIHYSCLFFLATKQNTVSVIYIY